MKYLLYDCEIIKMIPQRDQPNDARFDYCDSWNHHEGMGISVVGIVDQDGEDLAIIPDDDYRCSELHWFQTKASQDVVVGFNSRNFDDKLLQAHGINIKTDYDILEEVRIAAGYAADWRSVPKGFSYKLDAIAKANGMAKTGSGELAPMLWQQGKRQEVVDYCLMDCKITRTILELGLKGELVDPNTNAFLKLAPLVVVPF